VVLFAGRLKVVGKKLTLPEALVIVKFGDDVLAISKDWALKIATIASGGKRPIGPEIHDDSQSIGGRKSESKYYWHYHPRPRNGSHIFY